MDDFGNCWREIGLALGVSAAVLGNLDNDYSFCKQKATVMLETWKQKEGSNATMGQLAFVLSENDKNNIVEKMIGM